MKTKILKFDTKRGGTCVVGALGRAKELGIVTMPSKSSGDIETVADNFSMTRRQVRGLISLNDSRHWARLTQRLVKLGLYKYVERFARG